MDVGKVVQAGENFEVNCIAEFSLDCLDVVINGFQDYACSIRFDGVLEYRVDHIFPSQIMGWGSFCARSLARFYYTCFSLLNK